MASRPIGRSTRILLAFFATCGIVPILGGTVLLTPASGPLRVAAVVVALVAGVAFEFMLWRFVAADADPEASVRPNA